MKLIREIASSGGRLDGLTGLEREACFAARQHYEAEPTDRRQFDGVTIPHDVLTGSFAEDHDLDSRGLEGLAFQVKTLRRTLNTTQGGAGGYLVGTELLASSFIELLRNKALVLNLGTTQLTGLVGNVAIPRQSGGATTYWLPEGGTVTESDQALQQIGLVPHRLCVYTAYTRQLLAQGALSVEAFVRDDMAQQAAVEIDRVAITGGNAAGEPLGILNMSGINTTSFLGTATRASTLAFPQAVENANANLGDGTWLTTPTVKYKWSQIPEIAGSTFPIWLWMQDVGSRRINGVKAGRVAGDEAFATKNVPNNLVLYGYFSQLVFGQWAGINIVVDPYSGKMSEQVQVVNHHWVDFNARHPQSFTASTDAGNQ